MSLLSAPHFHDEAAAFERVEKVIWPNGPVCFHCGCVGRISTVKPNPEKRVRYGLKRCGDCKKQFTVRMGTIFEESKLPLHIWLQAIHLMCAGKKGVSSHQLHRVLDITYKTAWFLSHRIREAMRDGALAPFGQGGGDVEVDETYTGRVRSIVMDNINSKTVGEIVASNMATEARLLTDGAPYYIRVGKTFADHKTVNHGAEDYVSKTDPTVHTNTVEGFYSIFKRGMKGVYQHCSKKHLHRSMAEFDFRYSNRIAVGVDDSARAELALKGVVGKRLTYAPASEIA
jgi:transposase-like protein